MFRIPCTNSTIPSTYGPSLSLQPIAGTNLPAFAENALAANATSRRPAAQIIIDTRTWAVPPVVTRENLLALASSAQRFKTSVELRTKNAVHAFAATATHGRHAERGDGSIVSHWPEEFAAASATFEIRRQRSLEIDRLLSDDRISDRFERVQQFLFGVAAEDADFVTALESTPCPSLTLVRAASLARITPRIEQRWCLSAEQLLSFVDELQPYRTAVSSAIHIADCERCRAAFEATASRP